MNNSNINLISNITVKIKKKKKKKKNNLLKYNGFLTKLKQFFDISHYKLMLLGRITSIAKNTVAWFQNRVKIKQMGYF